MIRYTVHKFNYNLSRGYKKESTTKETKNVNILSSVSCQEQIKFVFQYEINFKLSIFVALHYIHLILTPTLSKKNLRQILVMSLPKI